MGVNLWRTTDTAPLLWCSTQCTRSVHLAQYSGAVLGVCVCVCVVPHTLHVVCLHVDMCSLYFSTSDSTPSLVHGTLLFFKKLLLSSCGDVSKLQAYSKSITTDSHLLMPAVVGFLHAAFVSAPGASSCSAPVFVLWRSWSSGYHCSFILAVAQTKKAQEHRKAAVRVEL